jgi:hypothetical protein
MSSRSSGIESSSSSTTMGTGVTGTVLRGVAIGCCGTEALEELIAEDTIGVTVGVEIGNLCGCTGVCVMYGVFWRGAWDAIDAAGAI